MGHGAWVKSSAVQPCALRPVCEGCAPLIAPCCVVTLSSAIAACQDCQLHAEQVLVRGACFCRFSPVGTVVQTLACQQQGLTAESQPDWVPAGRDMSCPGKIRPPRLPRSRLTRPTAMCRPRNSTDGPSAGRPFAAPPTRLLSCMIQGWTLPTTWWLNAAQYGRPPETQDCMLRASNW